MSSISRISLTELHDFLECPRRLSLRKIPEIEDLTTMALRTMMNTHHMNRISNVILNPGELRRLFSTSYAQYETRDHQSRRHRGVNKEKRKELVYSVASVINSFARIFGLYDDSLAGNPIGSLVKFNIECPCGKHHLYGTYDLLWVNKDKTYGIIYNFTKKLDKQDMWKYSNMPGLWQYILDKALGIKAKTKVCVYYPWVSKLKVFQVKSEDIENASKLICIASECKSLNMSWRLEDQLLCKVCRYKTVCHK